jgi:hypothetical protein
VPGWHTIWVHAVSVGETRAAEPLVDALMAAYPDSRIVLTHMTPTGRATGKALFAKHGARLVQSYLPYDTPGMVMRFLRQFTPRICILMETEVWPNLIAGCNERRIPVTLVNARLSERSLRRGRKFRHPDDRRGGRHRAGGRADRGRRRARALAGRAEGRSHRQHQVRRGGAAGGARYRRLAARAHRRATGAAVRQHARRRRKR